MWLGQVKTGKYMQWNNMCLLKDCFRGQEGKNRSCLVVGTGGRGQGIRKGCRSVNMV
jgi:hypothetical protein